MVSSPITPDYPAWQPNRVLTGNQEDVSGFYPISCESCRNKKSKVQLLNIVACLANDLTV
jgi:hypothetical protein